MNAFNVTLSDSIPTEHTNPRLAQWLFTPIHPQNSCGIGATNWQAIAALFSGRNPAERPAIVRSYSANSLPYPNNTDWRSSFLRKTNITTYKIKTYKPTTT